MVSRLCLTAPILMELVLAVVLLLPQGVLGGNDHHLRSANGHQKSSLTTLHSARRSLQEGGDALRQFINSAVLKLPELKVSQETWAGTMNLNITEFLCFDVTYAAISLDMLEGGEGTADSFHLEVTDLMFNCTMDIGWDYGSFGGLGTASVVSDKNYLSTKMSTDPSAVLNVEPILSVGRDEVTASNNCEGTIIDLDTLEFDGTIDLKVMNLYRGFIRHAAEDKVEEVFCDLMSEKLLGYALDIVDTRIDAYSVDLPEWRSDPLFLESSKSEDAENTALINLQNDEQAGDLVTMALKNLNAIYATKKSDPKAPTEDQMDYGINTMLREKWLQEDGGFALIPEGVRYSHTEQTELVDIQVTMTSFNVYGLDTATVSAPFSVIGSRTIQHQLFWNSVSVQTELTIEARASTLPNSIFANADNMAPIIEQVTATFGANDIDTVVSLMVPLDRSQVEALPVGYILNWESLPACIPSILAGINVSGLALTMGSIQDPIVQGIQSQDINQIAQTGIQIGLASFEDSVLRAIPNVFQSAMRDYIGASLVRYQCKANETEAGGGGRSRRLEEEFEEAHGGAFYFNAVGALFCVCGAALAAGLTMGLLSLDELMLLIKQRAGATEQERKAAASLLPIVRQHHLLLVSLLLLNSIANEALPLFLDKIVPGYLAVILSVTLVLFFGEIIPSAVFTGPDQVKLASRLAPLVKFVMIVLSPVAYPIAKVLDHVLHHDDQDAGYNRGELSALVRIQYEEHLATKSRRKSEIKNTLRKSVAFSDDMGESEVESYASKRSSSSSVRPEIRNTIRAMKQQFSVKPRGAELHLDEVAMVEGALQMRTTPATDVFTAWKQVFTLPKDMVLNERNCIEIFRSGYSRIPIYEKNPDDPEDDTRIVGILSSRQLIVVNSRDKRPVSTLPLAVPNCVAPHMTLVDLINLFQTGGVRGSHMALVCTRPETANDAIRSGKPIPDDAGLMGIITLEDVLESLIQEQIYDEYDRQEMKQMELARWGFKRWRKYVKDKKNRRDPNYQPREGPKMLRVVEEATEAAHALAEQPNEMTALVASTEPTSGEDVEQGEKKSWFSRLSPFH